MEDNSINILVVDDEEGILDVTEGYFQRLGYEVYTAGNGIEALEVLNSVTIECVFTDINMPKMDGLKLASELKKKDNTLPVVIMTGYPSLENSIQTLQNGVVDYLIKPVNLEQMELTLKRILRERQLFIENLILKEEDPGGGDGHRPIPFVPHIAIAMLCAILIKAGMELVALHVNISFGHLLFPRRHDDNFEDGQGYAIIPRRRGAV